MKNRKDILIARSFFEKFYCLFFNVLGIYANFFSKKHWIKFGRYIKENYFCTRNRVKPQGKKRARARSLKGLHNQRK